MRLSGNDLEAVEAALREPPADLAAHAARLRDVEPRRRFIGSVPRSKAWHPTANRAAIHRPVVAESLAQILVFVPPGKTGRIDVGHHSRGRHPGVAYDQTDRDQQEDRGQL